MCVSFKSEWGYISGLFLHSSRYSVVLQSKFIVNISFYLISAKLLHKVKMIDFFSFLVVASNNIMLNFPLL